MQGSDEILFLAHRLPFPPDRGDRIRSAHVLRALAQIAPVHIGCFVDAKADRAHEGEVASLAASACVVTRRKPLPLAGVEAMVKGEPVSLAAYAHSGLSRWVEGKLASGRIGAVYVFSGQMGQFVPPSWKGRLVVDLCDVDSAKFEAYARDTRGPMAVIHAREARLLAKVEAGLAARANHTLLISAQEAALFESRAPQARSIRVMGNGIDADHFAPGRVKAAPAMQGAGPHLLFTGQMDYPPNIAAASRMARQILPLVQRASPGAQFHIAGRSPAPEVRALGSLPGCTVHGAVPDMRPFLAGADIVVAPLAIARGVQNKVLEAMAMARPVVLSEGAATGIPARNGEHFAIGGDDADFAAQIQTLLTDRAFARAMGDAARRFVVERQSWPAMLADLPCLLDIPPQEARNAA
ncbi:TIGR03087 family PEP-CTERM/XrtA system glycosyltransferase [Alteraurantiacibacter palmitatis]|uniref:TIGR03087 family PEP-CTERM/XrtA system glycosyltransferase n=1 Tax=Alteraurantiacibacter palmitatis TaxID=2054628 RepID=A0ABV7E3D6_9SPHN